MLTNWLALLGSLTLAGSALVLAVFLLRLFLGRWLPKSFLVFLWLLAFAAFVAPVRLPLPPFAVRLISVPAYSAPAQSGAGQASVPGNSAASISRAASVPAGAHTAESGVRNSAPGAAQSTASGAPQGPRQARGVNWPLAAAAAHAGAAAALALSAAALYAATLRRLRAFTPVEDSAPLRALREKAGVRRAVPLGLSPSTPVPVTAGIFRAKIFLPSGFDMQNAELLHPIYLHELIHVKRRDNLLCLLALAICCLHWFNPLAWFAYARLNRELELSCDSAVIKRLGPQSRAPYARALLQMAGTKKERRPMLLTAFGTHDMKERVTNVMKTKRITPGARAACALSLLLAVLAFSAVSCTGTASRAGSGRPAASGTASGSSLPGSGSSSPAGNSSSPESSSSKESVSSSSQPGGTTPAMLLKFQGMSDQALADKLSDLDLCVYDLQFTNPQQISSENLYVFFSYVVSGGGGDYPKDYDRKWYSKADGKFDIPVSEVRQVLGRYFENFRFDPAQLNGYNPKTGEIVTAFLDGFGGARFPKLIGKRQISADTAAYTVGYYDELVQVMQYAVTYTVRFDNANYRYLSIVRKTAVSPGSGLESASMYLDRVDLVKADSWELQEAQSFAKQYGYTIEPSSGECGILTMPKSYTQTIPQDFKGSASVGYSTRYRNVGAYFKQCNAIAMRDFHCVFDGILGQRVFLLSYDTRKKDGTPAYLYLLFQGRDVPTAWDEPHAAASNDPRGSETYGGLLYRGDSVQYSK